MKFHSQYVYYSGNVELSCKLDEVFNSFVLHCFYCHANADWGDVEPEHLQPNEKALKNGNVILSAYKVPKKLIGKNLGCLLKPLTVDTRLLIRTDKKNAKGIRPATNILFQEEVWKTIKLIKRQN